MLPPSIVNLGTCLLFYHYNRRIRANPHHTSQAEFSTSERRATRGFDRKRAEYSLALKQTFQAAIMRHLYPRTQIDISVEILHADGGLLSASVNAITLALIDAGIAMRDYVVACSAGSIEQRLLTDLNGHEQNANAPDLTLGFMPKNRKINLVQLECKLPIAEYENLMDTAIKGCEKIYQVLQQSVQDRTWQLLHAREK